VTCGPVAKPATANAERQTRSPGYEFPQSAIPSRSRRGSPRAIDLAIGERTEGPIFLTADMACADAGVSTAGAAVTGIVFGYERRGQPLIVPVLAMGAASALVRVGLQDARSGGAALRRLEQLATRPA